MKKYLIFDSDISGHHIEYLWHIYSYFVKSNDFAVFIVNPFFKVNSSFFSMLPKDNIQFVYLSNEEYLRIKDYWSIKSSLFKTLLLNKYIKKNQPDEVIIITLFSFFPFFIFLSKKALIKGIVYSIYLRKKLSLFSYYMNKLFFYLLAKKSNIKSVFLLNDTSSAKLMNDLYSVSKFKMLPDPFLNLSFKIKNDFVEEDLFAMPKKGRRFIHFGSMDTRKGTLIILDALLLYSGVEELELILLGKVGKGIREEFYYKLNQLRTKNNVKVFLKDEFCLYDFVNRAVLESDYILMPYFNASQSSGMLGYAAYYIKPVIGPGFGLLGELIIKYSLGYTLVTITAESLLTVVLEVIDEEKIIMDSDGYLRDNDPAIFCDLLIS